jgi:hypothetical protein
MYGWRECCGDLTYTLLQWIECAAFVAMNNLV